ncbi:hypothetical protein [Streptomyces uncialis]
MRRTHVCFRGAPQQFQGLADLVVRTDPSGRPSPLRSAVLPMPVE